jgi:hypothetical protein
MMAAAMEGLHWAAAGCLTLVLALVFGVVFMAGRAARRWDEEQADLCRWRMTGVGLSDKEIRRAELRAIQQLLREAGIPETDERWRTLARAEAILERTSYRELAGACLADCGCVVCRRQREEEAA